MDLATLSFLHKTFQEVQRKQDWRAALDTLFVSLRGSFVFDNAAIYLEDSQTKASEVVYARAVGRGKAAEADSMWGEGIANEVLSKGKMILKEPRKGLSYANRLTEAHLLGFPLYVGGNMNGALVFIRFGGPQYTELHIQIASLQAFWATALIERKDCRPPAVRARAP